MSAKSNKFELSEEFVERRTDTLNVMSLLYRGKNEKDKSLERISDKVQTFSD